jgi:putative flippase GtrA
VIDVLKATFQKWMASGSGVTNVPKARNPADDDGTHPSAPQPPDVTIVIPTRNEAGNIAALVDRLGPALAQHRAELLFVDDSDDNTPDAVRELAGRRPLAVRLLHRAGGERTGGLGGAVLRGLREARAPWVIVMDGDLQHPPEVVPQLLAAAGQLEPATDDGVDLVVASRYLDGGSEAGLADASRRAVSGGATLLTHLLFPLRLRAVSDPMSGFFAVRRAALDLDSLRPLGFKILLELLVRTPRLTVREVPFTFAERGAGESKASLAEGLRFAGHLSRLFLARATGMNRPGAVRRGLGFAAVGASGIAVNTGLMWLLADAATLHMPYLIAAVLATQGSTTWNFAGVDTLVYRGPKRGTAVRRLLGFLGTSNAVLLLRLPLLALLVSVLGVHYLLANLLTLVLGFGIRFAVSERLTLKLEHR